MAESYFLLAATFIPLLLAPVAYLIGRKGGAKPATWFSFGALAVSTALLLVPAVGVVTEPAICTNYLCSLHSNCTIFVALHGSQSEGGSARAWRWWW